ncbi:NAD-dependent deacylase [Alphaproteobacteria bacterium]|nr:NAD-dependent deacylase [Alphaproteobacteria bacterium]
MLDIPNLDKISSIFILSGAGIDAESGINTFRASDGLWEGHDVNAVAHPDGFAKDRDLVYSFYNERRKLLLSPATKPNAAHYALADLEKHYQVDIVTQNISDLQQRAGSTSIIQMHGSLIEARCLSENNHVLIWKKDLGSKDQCEICQSPLRPNIVWFSEEVMHLDLIQKKAINADLFISIGTSNQVFPANSLVSLFKRMNKPTIELNLEKTVNSNQFDFGIYNKPATIAVEEFKNLLLESISFT